MNAITLLKTDHRTVEALFKEFESLGDKAKDTQKRKIVEQIIKELSVHAAIEEQLLYPAARKALQESEGEDDLVLEALEEHHVAKWLLNELSTLAPSDERYKAKVTVLAESIRHHVKEEETNLFPKLRALFSRKELEGLGEALMKAKKTAPTRPHPRTPDTPPANVVAGVPAAIVDRVKDAGRSLVRGERSKANGLSARSRNAHA